MKHIVTYNIFESNISESNRYLNSGDKIIFLDIDGVLRPINSYIGKDEYGQLFTEDCIQALRYLITMTGAYIVISSTWKASGLLIMKEIWDKRNLPGEVIDITPNEVDVVDSGAAEFYDLVDRGLEIEQWIKNNNFSGRYVIIDDITDFTEEQTKHYVKTDTNVGLTMDNVEQAINILKQS